MDADRIVEKMKEAGCCLTSAGYIAVDTQRLVLSHLAALETIEGLEADNSRCIPAFLPSRGPHE